MKSLRVSFLPMFFVCLGFALTAAIAYRIYSYPDDSARLSPSTQSPPGPAAGSSSNDIRPEDAALMPANIKSRVDEESVAEHQASVPLLDSAGRADEITRLVELAWFEPRAIRTGQDADLVLRMRTGEISGVSGILESPMRTSRMAMQCAAAPDSLWRCSLAVPPCLACGRWRVKELQLRLRSGVTVQVTSNHPLIASLWVYLSANQCDSAPPRLNGVAIGETDVADDGSGGDILFTLNVVDDGCGLAAISGYTESARGEKVAFAASSSGDENFWAARQIVSRATDRGKWTVSSVELRDHAGNVALYTASDAPLRDATFEIR